MLNEGLSNTTNLAKVQSRGLGTPGVIISEDSNGTSIWGEAVAIMRTVWSFLQQCLPELDLLAIPSFCRICLYYISLTQLLVIHPHYLEIYYHG